jgi:class 3 adenylate cyclase
VDHEEQYLETSTGADVRRVLVTLLFTDIVGSTERAARLGDRRWLRLVEAHHATVREHLTGFRGREVDCAGDGFFATFDTASNAIACGLAVTASVRALGLEVRAGLHTGECDQLGERVRGIAVHTAARLARLASPGEVLVTATVRDVVAGSGVRFEDRGVQALRGVPGLWRLYAVAARDERSAGSPTSLATGSGRRIDRSRRGPRTSAYAGPRTVRKG